MRVCALFLGLVAIATPANAERLVIDLASGVTMSAQRPAGTVVHFVIHNRIPTAAYRVVVQTRRIPIPAFEQMEIVGLGADAAGCDTLLAEIEKVYAADDEKAVAAAIASIEAGVADGKCPGEIGNRLVRTLAETRYDVPIEYVVHAGEEITITVTRGEKSWSYTVTGGSLGEWRITYGASVLSDRSRKVTLKGDAEKGFVITPESEPRGVRVIPSVFFTWMPSAATGNWSHGPTGGLGVDGKAPGLFAGWSATYNHNLMIAAGVSLAQHQQLRGKYTEGETLKEQLDAEQLMEGVYRPSWVVALTFRFGQNPFTAKPATEDKKKAAADGPGKDK